MIGLCMWKFKAPAHSLRRLGSQISTRRQAGGGGRAVAGLQPEAWFPLVLPGYASTQVSVN